MEATQPTLETLKAHGLTFSAEFVPFSKSRNAKEKNLSLNWKITLYKDGREVIRTDYMMGIGHAPSYKNWNAKTHGNLNSILHESFLKHEAEAGMEASAYQHRGKAIEPDYVGFMWSLTLDASVLDHRSYEDWAQEFGYDEDSRKGEAIYKQCLGIALALRHGLGDSLISQLQKEFQDY